MGKKRPERIADGQDMLRNYDELLTMLRRQLYTDGPEQFRVLVKGQPSSALNWRQARIDDVTTIITGLDQVDIPFVSRQHVMLQLTGMRRQLRVLNWPEREEQLAATINRIISRLRHTTRRPGIPARVRRKLKPASKLRTPRR